MSEQRVDRGNGLSVEPDLNVAVSLKPSQLSREVHDYLSPRKRTTYYFDSPQQQPKEVR